MIGVVKEIGETKVYPKKDKTGNVEITKLKIGDRYFTSFSKAELEGVTVGAEVEVSYTSKENTYEGKTYTNYNITDIQPNIEGKPQGEVKQEEVPQPIEKVETPKVVKGTGSNTINVGDKTFKVTIEEV